MLDDVTHALPEPRPIAHDRHSVQRVNEREREVSKRVVDVDILSVGVGRPASAVYGVELVKREGVAHVVSDCGASVVPSIYTRTSYLTGKLEHFFGSVSVMRDVDAKRC